MKKLAGYILVGLFSAVITITVFIKLGYINKGETRVIIQENQPSKLTNLTSSSTILSTDGFVDAALLATPSVVHIRTLFEAKAEKSGNPFWEFFGEDFQSQNGPQLASGSGVIISEGGYIVTNNHVVENANEIMVTLDDNKEFKAELIGTDPSTDLAVIKIKSNDLNLPYLNFANSDEIRIGEWVLAVGNPFNLASTVTAGIVSAKGRNINILREKVGNVAIESFIQTDAAVNPGNSGGALVDLKGNLVGINTAIATPNGTYAGYSFAVPSNLVKKVVADIMAYGIVQRGFMGVSIASLTAEQADDLKIEDVQGVYISEIISGSGAEDAGLMVGDVIIKINEINLKSSSELQELVARYSPGDVLKVEFLRKNQVETKQVTLKGRDNSTKLLSKEDVEKKSTSLSLLGGVFESLSKDEAKELGLRGGVKVTNIKEGVLSQNTQMRSGFIITKVNNQPVNSVEELESFLNKYTGDGVLIEGKYPNMKGTQYYAFGM